MCVPMHLHSKVLRQGVNGPDAGEISELAQNRLAIGVGYLPTLAEETPLQLVLRGAQHDNCISCRHQA